MFYIFFLLVIWINRAIGLSGRLCHNAEKGILECCYNHEEVNGVCTECKIGTVAYRGGICQICKTKMYGFKCLEECKCDSSQRCDPVNGCVSISSCSTSVPAKIGTTDTSEIKMSTITTHTVGAEIANTATLGTIISTVKTNLVNGLSKREWIVYSAGLSVFIIIIGMGIGYIVIRNKGKVSERNIISNEQIPHHSEIHNHQYLEIYDEIDESMVNINNMISDSVKKRDMKDNLFETVNIEGRDTDSSHSSRNENTDYLQVYQTSTDGNSNSSSDLNNECKTNSEYIKPYQSYNERQEIPHGYDICVSVHNDSIFSTDYNYKVDEHSEGMCVLKKHENDNLKLCSGYRKSFDNVTQDIKTIFITSNDDESLLKSDDTMEKCEIVTIKNVENKEENITLETQNSENEAIEKQI